MQSTLPSPATVVLSGKERIVNQAKQTTVYFAIAVSCLFLFASRMTGASDNDAAKPAVKPHGLSASVPVASPLTQTSEVLLQDNFDRPDSPSLGALWTEKNEVTSEFICSTGIPVGRGFTEVNDGSLTFHYINHTRKPEFTFLSGNGQPLTYAPLTHAVTSYPVTCSFTFTPHQDERTYHEVGLMAAANGFNLHESCHSFSVPNQGLGIFLFRTSSGSSNSGVQIIKYNGGNRTILAQKDTAFQFNYGTAYAVSFSINQDFSVTLQVSSGSNTEQLSSGATSVSFPLDQFFITDTQGGISADTTGPGDFLLRFDNILVKSGCLPAPSGLVGWWPGEGNANDLISGNNGTLQGGATYVSSMVGQGFHFNGVDGSVQIPDSPSYKPANVTVDAWVKFDSLDSVTSSPGLQYIVFKRSANSGWIEAYTLVKARDDPAGTGLDRFALAIAPADGGYHVRVFSTTVIQVGQFYHVALTYDGSVVKLYVNGNLEGQETANFPLNYAARPLFIGTTGEPIFDGKLNGTVDEVGIYNRALSASEIRAIYDAGSAGKCKPQCVSPPSGLTAWWPADGNADDIAGGNNGTLRNGATFVPGTVGQAFSFDGVDDYIEIADSPALRPTSLTIEGWFNFATTEGTRILFGKTAGTGTSESYVVYYAAGKLWATIGDAVSIGDQLPYTWAPALGTWHSIAYTFDNASGNQSLYVDGVSVASGTTAKRVGYDAHPVIIGAEFENEALVTFYKGAIDEVALYNRALSASEIQATFNAGSAGKCHTTPCSSGLCVTNVRARQLTDGSNRVEVLYDLNNALAGGASVSVAFSDNGGATYNIAPSPAALSGDIGPSVPNGANHRVLWSAAATLPPQSFANSFRSAITATAGNSATAVSNLFSVDLRTQSRKPVASFAFSPQSPTAGQAVQFTDASSGPPTSWVWDFDGDGFTDSNAQNPTHTFSGQGPHQVTLKVTNAYGTSSLTETVNVTSTATGPAVTGVRRQYEGVFLQNGSFGNTFDVSVNWHGSPGSVRFSVNGGPTVTEPGTLSGASHTFQMASDFPARLSPSTVTITPVNAPGMVGTPWVEKVYLFSYPTWLQLYGTAVNTILRTGEVSYELPGFEFPQPHLGGGQNIQLPSVARTLLGANLGARDLFGFVRGSFTSRGTGSLTVGAQGGASAKFEGMESSIDIKVAGSGEFNFAPPKGLEVAGASLGFDLSGTVSKEVGIADAIPGLRTLEDKPFVGRLIRFFNERATLKGEIGASGSGLWQWKQGTDGKLHFSEGTGTLGFDMKATLQAPIWEKRVSAKAWVSGGGSFGVGVPDPFLRTAEVHLQAGASLTIDFWRTCNSEATWNLGCTWTPSSGWQCDSGGDASFCTSRQDGKVLLSLIKPNYARFGKQSVLHPAPIVKPVSSKVPASVHEFSLIDNVYADAAPALVKVGSGRLLLWTHQDPDLPVEQSTGIAWSYNSGSGWTTPALIVDDTRAEFSPVAAVTDNGKLVAAWLRIKDPAFNTPITTLDDLPLFYTRLEVVSAVFDPATQTWGPVTQLTDDTAMDADLRLASDASGNLLLSWFSNPSADLISTASSPSVLKHSFWNGSAWGTPGAVASGLVGVGQHAAAIHGSDAVIVIYRDPDPAASTDGLLETFLWNGSSWSNAAPFAGGGVENRLPSVTYDSAGLGHVVWVRGSNLVHARLDNPTPETIRAGSASMSFYNAQLLTSAQGNLTLVWQEIVDNGPANVFAMLYDPSSQSWSADVRLTEDASEAHGISGFYDSDGRLSLVYLATDILRTSENVTIGNGVPLTINNIPQDGQTDLRLLEHSLITDLAVVDQDLSVSPQYPRAGEVVSAALAVHNAGDFGVGSFAVNLYAGSPDTGGILVGTSEVSGPFPAGATRTLTFSFPYPASGGNVVALVDPANTIHEFSEANNRATAYLTNTAPQVRLLATPTEGAPPLNVVLDASASFDNESDSMSFAWSFADGSPTANGATVSHTFSRVGLYPVTVAVVDGRGAVGTGVVLINVGCAQMTFSPDSLPDAPSGTAYSQTLSASGGTAPTTYVITAGALPPSLSLSAPGEITGIPTALGTFPFRVTASDANGCPSDHDYAINVVCHYTLSAVSASFPANGGGSSVNVTCADGCSWTAVSNDGWVSVTGGASGSGNGNVSYSVAADINVNPRTGTLTIAGQTFTVNQSGIPAVGLSNHKTDFDSDGKSDLGFYRSGLWGFLKSSSSYSTGSPQFFSWGEANRQPICADFDGDGKADIGYLVPPASGQSAAYAILLSSRNYSFAAGQPLFVPAGFPSIGDTPVVGDFDGDGKADPGIWRATQGVWIIPKSSSNYTQYVFAQWGQLGDVPVIADFDHDGKADLGFYRDGLWGILKSTSNYSTDNPQFFSWGGAGLQPVVGDFDGDGRADIGYIVPPTGGQSATYAILLSSRGYSFAAGQPLFVPAGFPSIGDTPVVGDFDGDGKTDPGIWRESQGVWIIPTSSSNYMSYIFSQWGGPGDIAFPNTTGRH
jgi:PKD repeat protein